MENDTGRNGRGRAILLRSWPVAVPCLLRSSPRGSSAGAAASSVAEGKPAASQPRRADRQPVKEANKTTLPGTVSAERNKKNEGGETKTEEEEPGPVGATDALRDDTISESKADSMR